MKPNLMDTTTQKSQSLIAILPIILIGSILSIIAVLIVLALIPLYLNPKSVNPPDPTTPLKGAYALSANLSSQINTTKNNVELRQGPLSNDRIALLQQIFQAKLLSNPKSSKVLVTINSAAIVLSTKRATRRSIDARLNEDNAFIIYQTSPNSNISTDRLNISYALTCRPFCSNNLLSFILQNVLNQINLNETLYLSLFTQTVTQLPNDTVLVSNIKDTRILQINNITLFGTKDFTGNVQQIYAIQTNNTIYSIDQGRITQIQTKDLTMVFQYNDTASHYKVNMITIDGSYEITIPSSAPNVTFPTPLFNISRKEKISDPFTGILLQIEDRFSGRSIDGAVLQLSYLDDQSGSNTVVMMNVGGGRYYVPLPNNDTTMDHHFNAENFRQTTSQQCESLVAMIRGYSMVDICAKSRESSRSWCLSIADEMSKHIVDSLTIASSYTDKIPIRPRSFGELSNFQTILSLPGENTTNTFLNSSNQVNSLNTTRSTRNLFRLSMLVLNLFRFFIEISRGICNEQTVAGNDIPDNRIIDIGKSQINIKFHYETYSIPDEIQVYYQGSQVFTSSCLGTNGEKQTIISLNADESSLRVNVIPNCQGDTDTAWQYSIECPAQLICQDGHCTCGTSGISPTQVTTPSINHCGADGGTFNWLIQGIGDSWGFSPACDTHDQCYATCEEYKSDCDNTFLTDMRTSCERNWIAVDDYEDCLDWASRFYSAVDLFGNKPFKSGQQMNCECFEN